MNRSLFIVPRWAGRPDTDYYVWLEAKLRETPQGFSSVRTPREPAVLEALLSHFGSAPHARE